MAKAARNPKNSIRAVAEEEGFSVAFIYTQIATGKLIARKCERRTVILPQDRAAWLKGFPAIAPAKAA